MSRGAEIFINDGYTSLRSLGMSALRHANDNRRNKFEPLNRHVDPRHVGTGEIIILGDGSTPEITAEEIELIAEAERVSRSLRSLSDDDADFMMRHYDLLNQLTKWGSASIGAATAAWQRHFSGVAQTLNEIGAAYEQVRQASGKVTGDAFYTRRQELFAQLKQQLRGIGRLGTGLEHSHSIKRLLGLSSRSLAHHWRRGEHSIPGYAERIERVTRSAQWMKHGGYFAIALDAVNGALSVHKACTVGRERECKREKVVQAVQFTVGTALGAAGGVGAPLLCAAIGIGTAGIGGIACMLVAVGSAGYIAGELSERAGHLAGQVVYGDE